jgi:hypothetical protein
MTAFTTEQLQNLCYAQFLQVFPRIAMHETLEEMYKSEPTTLRIRVTDPKKSKYGMSVLTNEDCTSNSSVMPIVQFRKHVINNNRLVVTYYQDTVLGVMYDVDNNGPFPNNATERQVTNLFYGWLHMIPCWDYKHVADSTLKNRKILKSK